MDPELMALLRKAERARSGGASVERINQELRKLTEGKHTFRSLAEAAQASGVPLQGGRSTPSRGQARGGQQDPREAALQRIAEGGGNAVTDFLRMGAQGATFGTADEAAGAIAGIGAMMPGGRSPSEAYRETRDASRQRVSDLRETSPVASWLAEGAGMVATGAGAARIPKLAAAARARPGASAVAGGGAIGAAETDGGLLDRALGAVAGGAAGAAGAVAAKAAPHVARGARRAMTRSGKAAEQSAGRVAGSIDEAAERAGPLLDGAVSDAGLNPSLLSNRPAAIRTALEEAGEDGAEQVRAGILRRVAEDLEAGDVAVSDLASRSGLSRLRATLPADDFDRVSRLLSEEASAEAIANALRSAFKIGAGAGAGLGLLDAVIGG